MNSFGEYIIYVDESGDHSLENVNKEFPLFVLAFCIFKKSDYANIAFDIIQKKLHKSKNGTIKGFGLKIFP